MTHHSHSTPTASPINNPATSTSVIPLTAPRTSEVPQSGTTFVDVVVEDLVPYLDAFDPVEALLVLNELQRRLCELDFEYQLLADAVADDVFAA